MITTDNYATISAEGYLLTQMPAFERINGGAFQWTDSDVILADYDGGWAFFTISHDFDSLIPFSGIAPTPQPSSVLVTDVNSNELWQGPLTDGQLIVGVTGGTPVANELIAGDNVTIDIAPGTITINATGGGGSGVTSTQVQRNSFNYAAGTYSAGNYTVTLSPAVTVLTDGLLVTMIAGSTNATTTPTLQLNALSPKPIVSFGGSPAIGDILADSAYLLVYNGDNDNFQLLNPSLTAAQSYLVQKQYYNFAPDIGVANAYVANLVLPPLVSLSDGITVYLQIANTNTGASTLAVNGSSAAPIVSLNGSALTGGEIVADSLQMFMYSSAENAFVLMTPYVAPSVAGVTSITGTANQVIASSSTGNVTLSLPQNIATTSSPTFDAPIFTAPVLGIPTSGNLVNCTNLSVPDGLNASGTPGATTFLRGDGVWSIPAGTGVASVSGTTDRITSTGGINPVIDISSSYVGQSSITTLGTVTVGTWNGTTIDVSHGGTGVTSVTTNPTATSWAGWDSNENLLANNFLYNTQTYNTAIGNLSILVSSPYYTILTGNTSRYLLFPDNTTIPLGFSVRIFNNGLGTHTLFASDDSIIYNLLPATTVVVTNINTSVSAATSWSVVVESGQTINLGLQNQLAYYASNGQILSGLSTAANSLLVTDSSGAPSLGTDILSDITINQVIAGKGNGDGVTNTVFGAAAGPGVNYTMGGSVSLGFTAGANATSSNNIGGFVAIGLYAGLHANDYDVFIGSETAQEGSGGSNVGVGAQALYRGGSSVSACTAIGTSCLPELITGQGITALGSQCAQSVTSGSYGIFIGAQCAQSITSSNYGIFIGAFTGATNPSNCDNVIAIGAGAIANSASGPNGPGISFGASGIPVGFNSEGLPYANNIDNTAGYWRVTVNGTNFLMPLMHDGVSTTSSCFLTDSNGTPFLSNSMQDGQLIIGATGANPAPGNIVGGTGISVTNTANQITISSTSSGFPYVTISGTIQNADVNHGYIPTNSALTTINLPAVCVAGDKISIRGYGTGGWVLQANTGQIIAFNQLSSTIGGSFASAYELDTIDVVCLIDNTFWTVEGAVSAGLIAA